MLFTRLSAIAAVVVWASFPGVLATDNQQVMDCEEKCSQRWSFPAPAAVSSAEPTTTKTKTKTHTSSSPVYTTSYAPPPETKTPEPEAPEPTTTSAVVHNAVAKPSSSTIEHIAVAASPSSTREAAPAPTPELTSEPTPEPTPAPTPEPAPTSNSPSIAAYLDPHNAARAAHGAAPLTWSDDLAKVAQSWADKCVFEHSGGSVGPYGENLAAGSGAYAAGSGVAAWVNEAPEYSSSNPVPSHFTQVVWKATTQVGCAVASCNLANFDQQFWPAQFHVCEYSSAGNVIGQFAANVQA